MVGDDQTTLMGLPMIQLCKILREFGISTLIATIISMIVKFKIFIFLKKEKLELRF